MNDGAFNTMMEAIQNSRTPDFQFMQYELTLVLGPPAYHDHFQ
jgi:hypothetical protein